MKFRLAAGVGSLLVLVAAATFVPWLSRCALPLFQGEHSIEWVRVAYEDFEGDSHFKRGTWVVEQGEDRSLYADAGPYHRLSTRSLPRGYRLRQEGQVFTLESYSRAIQDPSNLASMVTDPVESGNHVLKIRSPEHTDGTVLRSTKPLPSQYKICLKAGFPSFGDGAQLPNGYRGDERADPWIKSQSINENGFYWLAILSEEPKPRNNIWIHHHRKVVMDSDNHLYPRETPSAWSRIWNGTTYDVSGQHPVMMFVLDAHNRDRSWDFDHVGMPFISWSGGRWNEQASLGEIRAVDAYKDQTWYRACIWKTSEVYGMEMQGDFQFGGRRIYRAEIPIDRVYLGRSAPDYFMAGDPHHNFYRGEVFYDDVELFVPRQSESQERVVRHGTTELHSFTDGIEGPALSSEGQLYVVNAQHQGTVGRVAVPPLGTTSSPLGWRPEVVHTLDSGGVANGLAFDSKGDLYGVDYVGHRILRFLPRISSPEVVAATGRLIQPNDLAIASWGEFFLTDPDFVQNAGGLWSWSSSRGFRLLDQLRTPNGLALSNDEQFLFVNESADGRIWKYPLEGPNRILGPRSLFAVLGEGPQVMLDGMKVDSKGVVYVTLHGGSRVARFSADGQRLGDIQTQGTRPTNLVLREGMGGIDLWITLADLGALEWITIEKQTSSSH